MKLINLFVKLINVTYLKIVFESLKKILLFFCFFKKIVLKKIETKIFILI